MEFSHILNKYISDWFENQHFAKHPEGLYQPIEYALSSGGKRLRPTLLLAANLAFGGTPEMVRSQCLGIEMFHNFTLVHDDVMDKADVRRGRPTVHHKWSANTAILSGDAMLTMATELISACPDDKLREVLSMFNRTAMEVYEGQQLDMDFECRTNVALDEYMEMIRLKTSVLLGGACRLGAIMAGASEEICDAIYSYGEALGLAFQMRDDWLDTFGDPVVFGKEIGGDILNRKKTWLLITALAEAPEELPAILSEDLEDEEMIRQVKEVYLKLKLDVRCNELAKSFGKAAIDKLSSLNIDNDARKFFESLATEAYTRTH